MKLKAEDYIDKAKLEKSLGIDLDLIIKEWKKGKSDSEIASQLDISEWKLQQARAEVQQSHFRARIKRRKEAEQ